MVTLHHRIKTHGAWQLDNPSPVSTSGATPTARTYLVDHTGTRRLPTQLAS